MRFICPIACSAVSDQLYSKRDHLREQFSWRIVKKPCNSTNFYCQAPTCNSSAAMQIDVKNERVEQISLEAKGLEAKRS